MSRTPYYDENDNYFGPRVYIGGFEAEGSAGSAVGEAATPKLTGYLDTILFDNGDDTDTFDLSVVRQDFADEVAYTKTGLTDGAVVRPAAVEHKSEDGAALTTRRRIWLQNESLLVSVANASPVPFTFVIVTLPH